MSLTMYRASIPVFIRGLEVCADLLKKGQDHAGEKDIAHADVIAHQQNREAPHRASVRHGSAALRRQRRQFRCVAGTHCEDGEVSQEHRTRDAERRRDAQHNAEVRRLRAVVFGHELSAELRLAELLLSRHDDARHHPAPSRRAHRQARFSRSVRNELGDFDQIEVGIAHVAKRSLLVAPVRSAPADTPSTRIPCHVRGD